MRLYVDKNLMINEFKTKLIQEIQDSRTNLENEIKNRLGYKIGKEHSEIKVAVEEVEKKVILYVYANAIALFDNYGSGSKMDVNGNRLITDYIGFEAGSNWNPRRSVSDTRIKGRPAGEYTDIFGEKRYSSGAFEGIDLEGKRIPSGKNGSGSLVIEPHDPSHAIEYGLNWYDQEFKFILNRAISKMDFTKCFSYK